MEAVGQFARRPVAVALHLLHSSVQQVGGFARMRGQDHVVTRVFQEQLRIIDQNMQRVRIQYQAGPPALPDGVHQFGGFFVFAQAAACQPNVNIGAMDGALGGVEHQFGIGMVHGDGQFFLRERHHDFAAAGV